MNSIVKGSDSNSTTILIQTVKESEKPAHKQTMGLAVSTLRGDDDDTIRSAVIIYLI